MTTMQALIPCFTISYNTTHLNNHRNHLQTITSPNKVTFVNTSNYDNTKNAFVIDHPRSFPPKPVLVSSSRTLRMSAISALTLNDDRCWTTSHHQHCLGDPCLSLQGFSNPIIVVGSYGSSPTVTLERPKPELDVKTSKPVLEATVGDFDHNNGDNIGKDNVGGGDKGGGGPGDEDDYFEDFDDGEEGDDEGLFSRRITLPENFLYVTRTSRLSVPILPANTNALGYGAFLGLYTNWRYPMICRMDKLLYNHFNVVAVSLFPLQLSGF